MAFVLVVAAVLAQDGGTLRLRAVGDVMLGTSVPEGYLPPGDGAQLLDDVRAVLADADLTFANLEGPLCDSGTSAKCKRGGNCFAFRSPTRYAKYLTAAGVDFGSTANNHSGDFGEACRRETERALDGEGIVWSGPPGSIGSKVVNGRRVGLVAFHTSGATNDVNDVAAAKKLVGEAKRANDVVIVSFHGGGEGLGADRVHDGAERYLGENRGDLKVFARGVVDAGADIVIGHGPHVLRGMEIYKGHLIAYSLGNFATYGRFSLGGALGVSVVLEAELGADGQFLRGKLFSTKQEGKGVPMLDETKRGQRSIAQLSERDFPKSAVKVSDDGVLSTR